MASLSSNWKKLQATLSSTNSSERPSVEPKPLNAKSKRPSKSAIHSSRVTKATSKRSKMDRSLSLDATASLSLWADTNSSKGGINGHDNQQTASSLPTPEINSGLTKGTDVGKYVAIDCEMVGVGGDEDRSSLARVSVVNFHGVQVYDSFVRPKELVTDWRTHVSGVSAKDMNAARSFEDVQQHVADLLNDRILVGHGLQNDLDALMLGHPKRDIRDTSKYSGFRKYSAGRTPSLKKLAKEVLGIDIQDGQHSSVQDARAAMLLFRKHKHGFELEHSQRYPQASHQSSAQTPKKRKNRR